MPELPSNRHLPKQLQLSENDRHLAIFKSNELVQNTRYSMPLEDQKILARLISMIGPHQHGLKLKFSTREYMQMTGLKWSGSTFNAIKYSLKHLADDSFYIQHPDGSSDLWRWIARIHADPNEGHEQGDFIVEFPKELRPYLFDPQIRYKTIYRFSNIILMKSKYSPRLFEIFKSNQSRASRKPLSGLNYTLDELRRQLDLVHHNKHNKDGLAHTSDGHTKFKYAKYYDFKRNVLQPACYEINRYTDYNVKIKPVRGLHSKKVIKINVVMLHKNKKEMAKRNVLLYCATNDKPRSEWSSWREDMATKTFYKVNQRNSKKSKSKSKGKSKHVIEGHYRVIDGNNQKEKDNLTPSKRRKLATGKKHPFGIVDYRNNEVQYYNPLSKTLFWSTKKERKQCMTTYSLLLRHLGN